MNNENQPIVVNLPEGQNTLTFLSGNAPKQLDEKAPLAIDIEGTIFAPLDWLVKRVGDIDQHKAHILVNRDELEIVLIFNEDDPYTHSEVTGTLSYSDIYKKLGINSDKMWQPEVLSRFLKLNRSFFKDKEQGMKIVTALKRLETKVEQEAKREREENGTVGISFRQQVASTNIPESFTLRLPVFSGGEVVEIEVETFVSIDGADIKIALQSAGANDAVEDVKLNGISDVVEKIREIAPEIAIIEQ